MLVTPEQVRNWLGSEAQYSDAIGVIVDIVRGDYPIEMLKLDIKDSLEEVKDE